VSRERENRGLVRLGCGQGLPGDGCGSADVVAGPLGWQEREDGLPVPEAGSTLASESVI